MGQTGHTRGSPAKILYVYSFLFCRYRLFFILGNELPPSTKTNTCGKIIEELLFAQVHVGSIVVLEQTQEIF